MRNFTALNDNGENNLEIPLNFDQKLSKGFWCIQKQLCHLASQPGKCKNYQEMKIQEQVQKLVVGTMPRNMWVTLDADLVERCKPGDDVRIRSEVPLFFRPS